MRHHNNKKEGFALLMTLIVVSVVISIGITLIDITIKQLKLASGTKDSESSFHAANAGVECIRYWRLASSTQFETGASVPITCFGVSTAVTPTVTDLSAGPEDIYRYVYQIPWTTGLNRCSQVTMLTLSSDPSSVGVTLSNVPSYISGYPFTSKFCQAGGRCTIISVQGYNRACSAITQIGTVQREVLLEL